MEQEEPKRAKLRTLMPLPMVTQSMMLMYDPKRAWPNKLMLLAHRAQLRRERQLPHRT